MRSMPKRGTLERVMLEKMIAKPEGVTASDFWGTAITESNILRVAQNLATGMYESEADQQMRKDA